MKQPDTLCTDIRTFCDTKHIVCDLYQTIYADYVDTEDDPLLWLDNDITRFMNNDVATINGYTQTYLEIWRRLYYFSDKSNNVIEIITDYWNHKGNVNTNINMKLGLMNIQQRKMLLAFLYQIWNNVMN